MARGLGDEGAAVDLKGLAEADLVPRLDWGQLADILIAAEATTDVARRRALIADAKKLAGTDTSALALIKTTTDRISTT